MQSWLVAGILMLAAAPTVSSAPASFTDGATRFACGKSCRDTQLVCALDAREHMPAGLTAQDIATSLPWGQTDFWFMMGAIADRPESGIVDSQRVSGPTLVSFGGLDWVWANYDLPAAKGVDLAGSLVMWPDGDEMVMLRCSFLAHADAKAMIEELASSSRP